MRAASPRPRRSRPAGPPPRSSRAKLPSTPSSRSATRASASPAPTRCRRPSPRFRSTRRETSSRWRTESAPTRGRTRASPPKASCGSRPRAETRRWCRETSSSADMEDAELDEEAYATKVEEAFIAERGTPFLLSPKDWTLIRGWREGGIPVDVVIRAVRDAFEKRRARGQAGKISSIAYCANSVEELWEMERRGLVGKALATPAAGADAPAREESLALLATRLRSASQAVAGSDGAEDLLRRSIEKAAVKIDAMLREGSFEESERA